LSGASVLGLVFSTRGIILSVLIVTVWLLARPWSRSARRCLIGIALGYTIVSTYPVPRAIARLLPRPFHPLTRADVPSGRSAVVLLGSGSLTATSWSGDRFSVLDPMGAARTLEASRVSRLIDAEWVISSSGRTDPDYPAESAGQTMRDALVQLGVPAERVSVEQTSTTTHDEAVMVAAMLPSMHVDHVILVTSGMHMRRSLGAFRAAGIDAIPAIANEPDTNIGWRIRFLPTGYGLVEASLVAHEVVGLGYYTLRGWNR
jgi:uncharacterized SAM-binding protein YcdF (DUF218 family)